MLAHSPWKSGSEQLKHTYRNDKKSVSWCSIAIHRHLLLMWGVHKNCPLNLAQILFALPKNSNNSVINYKTLNGNSISLTHHRMFTQHSTRSPVDYDLLINFQSNTLSKIIYNYSGCNKHIYIFGTISCQLQSVPSNQRDAN